MPTQAYPRDADHPGQQRVACRPRSSPGVAVFALPLGVAVVALALMLAPAIVQAQGAGRDCTMEAGNLLATKDCGFEQPTASFSLPISGNTGFPDATNGPWFTGPGGFELDDAGPWLPNHGLQSSDLNLDAQGEVFQDVVGTQPGRFYTVSFALAGNPGCDHVPAVKTLTVTFGGTSQAFQFDTTNTSQMQPGWMVMSFGPLP